MSKVTVIPLLFSPKGVRRPVRADYYWWCAARDVQQWFLEKVGATFNLGAPLSLTSLEGVTREDAEKPITPEELEKLSPFRDVIEGLDLEDFGKS